MAEIPNLSTAEVDLLFAAQAAEMEALVAMARADLAYQKQRQELTAAADRASEGCADTFARVVQMHGYDPDQFEADIEAQLIVPKDSVLSLFKATQEGDPKEEERERSRSSAVAVRPAKETDDENDG